MENQDKLETADALLKRIQQERAQRHQQQLTDWEANGKQGSKPKAPKPLPPLTAAELAELPELPEGWGWVSIDVLLSVDKKPMATGPFGTLLSKSDHRLSGLPVLGIENIGNGVFVRGNKIFVSESKAEELESFKVEAGDVVISRSGTVGEICKIPEGLGKAFISTNLIRVSLNPSVINQDYFVYLFQGGGGVKQQVKALCKGSSRDFLNQTILSAIAFPLPSVEEQKQIVLLIDEKLSEADQLDQTLTTSLQQVEALRQSILKKAFSGQLVAQDANDEPASMLLARIKAKRTAQAATAKPRKPKKERGWPAPAKTNVIPFPVKIGSISATDLHAGILARAYRLHEQNSKHLAYFGHVKAEKIAHLVEAHLGIDLEREPIKDVAGPNDYPHLKKVESRARKANWFDVLQQNKDGAYVFSKKHGFDALLDRTASALGERIADVDALLKLLLPLNTRQAEIVATLYAAWNNLLLLGHSPEDEEIVCESREDWHESKLQIDREKFFKGLEWMRKQGLVPAGRGRYVAEKSKQPKSGEVIHD